MMKVGLAYGLAILVGFLCALPSPAEELRLTILHSSEHHGQAMPVEERGKPRAGGMAGRAALVAQTRQEGVPTLLVDSGDILIGTALSSFFRGEPDIKAMNLMGYDAMAAGNHDFDFGLEHLAALQASAQFPILCTNLLGKGVSLPCRSFAVLRMGKLAIGLISLLGHTNFPDTFNRQVAARLDLQEPIETARQMAAMLRSQHEVDLVVALTHQGTEEDLAVLAQVPEIDVIVGGHTEGFEGMRTNAGTETVETLPNPGPLLVKAQRLGLALGRLDLQIERPGRGKPRVLSARARNLSVTEAVGIDPSVADLVQEYVKKLDAQTGKVIGRSLVTLDGESARIRSRETNLGDLLADLLRTRFGAEVALLNSGQIRDSIPAGPVEIKRLLRVLPFNSPTVTCSITGGQLLAALENSVSRFPETHGRFLQISGLTVAYDLSAPSGQRVVEVKIGGRELEPLRRYAIATDSFLADGGDGYTMLKEASDRIERQVPMRDLLLEALAAGALRATSDGRIRFIGPEGAAPAGQSLHRMH